MKRHGLSLGIALLVLLALPIAGRAASGTGPHDQEGRSGSFHWTVATEGGPASESCLRVAIVDRHGRFSLDRARFRGCGTPRPRAPLIVGGAESRAMGGGLTVLAVAVAPGVDRLRVGFADGAWQTAAVHRRGATDSARFGLGVIALGGSRCATELVAKSADGEPLWRVATQSGACGG